MSKEVALTIQVEEDLHDQFAAAVAVAQERRPASAVMGDLMREYIQRHRPPQISKAEQRLRQEAVDYARASVGLEGFKPDEATEARARLYIEGHISTAEFVNS